MEKAKTRKIKKWDEVHGEYETEVSEDMGGSSPEEAAGAGPSISRNPMRGIEDMVEQNDNSFDGVINNVKAEEAGISSLTAYLVRMALHGFIIVMDLSDLKEILRLLQISGNNLNQYAKKANETGSIYREDIEELKTNQKEILQEMRKVLDRLTAIM